MKPVPLSPDGAFYLAAGRGELVPHPYRLRWLLPRVLGAHVARWVWLTRVSYAALAIAAAFYFAGMGLRGGELAFAAALLCALPGLRLAWRLPVLIDAPSFTLALIVAGVTRREPLAGAVLSLVLGSVRETGPVFAACWAWHPAPLVGLLAVGFWRPRAMLTDDAPDWLRHPVRAALALRLALGLDGCLYVRPWGAALLGLVHPTTQTLVTLSLAYAQLFMAQDTMRLVVWAAPPLVLGATQFIHWPWLPLALLATALHRELRA
jgi:hypothetical protein